MRIDFDEEKHEYSVDGKKIPSVSEILQPLSADRYDGINKSVLAMAAARGTAVHEACEAIDYGMNPEVEPGTEGYVKAYMEFIRDYSPRWEMIERIVGYKRADGELPLFAGTVDRFGLIDGNPCVVDIKTYASLTTDAFLSASCQTALYASAIESEAIPEGMPEMVWGVSGEWIRRYILQLKADGSYRFASVDNFDKERGFKGEQMAWQLYNLYVDKQKVYESGKKRKKRNDS